MRPAGSASASDGPGSSRAATQRLLGVLRSGGWTPRTWARFWAATSARSVEQVRTHPYAFAQLTGLHALFAAVAAGRGRVWVTTSWAMTVTHLGLLEERRSLGWANLITVARANLPAVGDRCGTWLPVLAVVSDVADGALARSTETTSPFGRHADFLADTAVWTWFVLRHEPSRAVQVITIAGWLAPVVAVTGLSVARGGMVDVPRSRWWRPLAALQAVLCARAIVRGCWVRHSVSARS